MKSYDLFITEATQLPFTVPTLEKQFISVLTPLLGKDASFREFVTAILKLGKKYEFVSDYALSPGVDSGNISVFGYYDEEGDVEYQAGNELDPPIQLVLIFNKKDKKFTLTQTGLIDLARGLAEVLAHEWMHKGQAAARNYRGHGPTKKKYMYKVTNIEAGSYLANDDEIETHAFNMAGALLGHFGNNVSVAVRYLQRPKPGVDDHFDAYVKTFGSTKHPVMRRLYKKIVFFLNDRVKKEKKNGV